ncbi:hypothetical protein MBCUT_05080 [Methanobrevibacter cuticularis]|uniref:CARDB domain-containing protein n=1 Tax=Methanobrevibacter cuticularis TaxID=47311 RepID=A0A166EPR2_9EURY|nr:CARDB domain-containing protein [Methanobrevibacter cuticularis]KZX16878.1 hypothetical protein MBCUT_05080 [Methanobrevibacter cuticularis]
MNKNNMFIFILVLGLFFSLSAVSASSIYVGPNGNDTNDGMSENSSKATISNAIENIGSGGTVILAMGIYKGDGNYNINIEKNLTIKGSSVNKTIIDGQGLKNLFKVGLGSKVLFENIIFANAYTSMNGAAIYNEGDSTLINCQFINNRAFGDEMHCGRGAAIYNIDGNVSVSNSSFINNTGNMYGGAINNNYGENFIINNSVFINNSAVVGGGAIDTNGGKYMLITNSLFINNNLLSPNNLIGREGGAIVSKNSNLIIKYCAFYNNYDYYGNTIYNNMGNISADYNFWGTNDNISNVNRGFNVNNYYKLVITPTIANNAAKVGETLTYTFFFVLNTNGSKEGIKNLPSFNINIYQNGNLIGAFDVKNSSIKTTKLLTNKSILSIGLFDSIINSYIYTAKKSTFSPNKKIIYKPDLKIVKIARKNNKYYIKIKNIGNSIAKKNYFVIYTKNKIISKKILKSLKKGSSTILKIAINKKYRNILKKFKIDYKNQVKEINEQNNIIVRR